MNQKRKKMIKAPILFILFVILFFTLPFIYVNIKEAYNKKYNLSPRDLILKSGYSIVEAEKILENKKAIEYAENNYNTNLINYLDNKDFDLANIEEYDDYIKLNKDVSIDDAIYLVNNKIDYKYSEKLIEYVKAKYFIKENIQRYLEYSENNPKLKVDNVIKNVNTNLDYKYYSLDEKTDISKGLLMIANKYYKLGDKFEGYNLVNVDNKYTKNTSMMNEEAYKYYVMLYNDALSVGYHIYISSAYRSYQSQYAIYNSYINSKGKTWADKYSARPGYSEHQTGLAIDVCKSKTSKDLGEFTNSNEFKWMEKNSYKYGYILRYGKTTTDITGYSYESWHFRYVGLEAAMIIHDNNLTFEEYYAYYVNKKDSK